MIYKDGKANSMRMTLRNRSAVAFFLWLVLAVLVILFPGYKSFAAGPAPVDIYYVPMPEPQMLTSFTTISNDPRRPDRFAHIICHWR